MTAIDKRFKKKEKIHDHPWHLYCLACGSGGATLDREAAGHKKKFIFTNPNDPNYQ